MTIFQLILLATTAFFAYQVYIHINQLKDQPQNEESFEEDGIVSDLKELTPATLAHVRNLIDEADREFEQKNYDKALTILREANRKKPFDSEILYKIAFIHYINKNYQDAIEALEDAIKSYKNDPDLYSLMASSYRAKGGFVNLNKAEEYIKEAIHLDKNNPKYYFNLGNIYLDKDKKEEAKWAYEKALEIDENFEAAKEELEKLKTQNV